MRAASYRIHKSLIDKGKSNLYVSKKSIPDISIQESPNKFDSIFNLRPQLVSKFIKLMILKLILIVLYLFCLQIGLNL